MLPPLMEPVAAETYDRQHADSRGRSNSRPSSRRWQASGSEHAAVSCSPLWLEGSIGGLPPPPANAGSRKVHHWLAGRRLSPFDFFDVTTALASTPTSPAASEVTNTTAVAVDTAVLTTALTLFVAFTAPAAARTTEHH